MNTATWRLNHHILGLSFFLKIFSINLMDSAQELVYYSLGHRKKQFQINFPV